MPKICIKGKKEEDRESGRDKDLSPTLSLDSSNICIQNIDIPRPLPNLGALIMDDNLIRNFFKSIYTLI